MAQLDSVLSDAQYRAMREQNSVLRDLWAKKLDPGTMTKLEGFKKSVPIVPRGTPNDPTFEDRSQKFLEMCQERYDLAKSFVQEQVWKNHPNLQKAGVASNLGFNFYDLRGPAFLIYPVNVHFRNTIARIGKVNDGYGSAANWKATRNPGSIYFGVSEGNRGEVGTPDEIDYFAKYKEGGAEGSVTFTAEFAGEGYTDNLADEHLRDLHRLFLAEEGMIINGNSGTGGAGVGGLTTVGYKLGTAPTPTGAVTATHATPGAVGNVPGAPGNADLPYTAAFTTSSFVSVCCVLLTAMGNPNNNQYGYGVFPTIASGLTPQRVRVNADGSTDLINGGMSAVSAMATPVQATSGNLTLKFSIPAASLPLKGVFGYAWFVDVEASGISSLANAKFAGITSTPFCFVSGTPTGTQTANATNLSVDNSYNSLDFDGFMSYAAGTPGTSYTDLQGGTLTSQKNGRVTEIENVLAYIWNTYQTGVDEIWGDGYAIAALDAAIRWSGTNASSVQFYYQRDSQNNILGGFVVSAYQSRYAFNSPNGANAIPIRIHPMMPAGTLYFRKTKIPYTESRLPYAEGMLVQRDYYSIEWPQTSRKWPFGTYVHEVLAMTTPWIPSVITGVGPFVGS